MTEQQHSQPDAQDAPDGGDIASGFGTPTPQQGPVSDEKAEQMRARQGDPEADRDTQAQEESGE